MTLRIGAAVTALLATSPLVSSPARASGPAATALELEEAEALVNPPRPPTPDRIVKRRAIGLGVAAAVFGVPWLLIKTITSRSDRRIARDIDAGEEDPLECVESCYVGPALNAFGSATLLAAAGFLGGSMHAYGRLRGRRDLSRRAGLISAGVGVGAMLGGFGLFAAGLVLARDADTELTWVRRRDLAWWSLTGLGLSGAALAGFGHGIVRGNAERPQAASLSLAPMFTRGGPGLALIGRF